jgi:hypothetical protein
MVMKTIADVQAATDAELLAFWNVNDPHHFDAFPEGRASFEIWCLDIVFASTGYGKEEMAVLRDMADRLNPLVKPEAAPSLDRPEESTAARPAPVRTTIHKISDASPSRSSNAEGVSESWGDATISAARLKRDGVSVEFNGVTSAYRSVNEALRELRLPVAKHIRFRGKLKASRDEVFEHEGRRYHFKITD